MSDTTPSTYIPESGVQEGTAPSIEVIEMNGLFFEINWDELDPPEGTPGAEEIPHEEVVAWAYAQLGLPRDML